MTGYFVLETRHDKPEEFIQFKNLPPNVSITDLLSMDIETTGTDPSTSVATILGGTYFEPNGNIVTIQYFLTSKEYEKELFEAFAEFISDKSYFISFNGDGFDIPYVQQKFQQYDIAIILTEQTGIDLYKWAKRYQGGYIKILRNKGVPEHKIKKPFGNRLTLKAIEKFAGIDREDTIFGVTMIEKYNLYEFYYRTSLVDDLEELQIRLAMVRDQNVYNIYQEGNIHKTKDYLHQLAEKLKDDLLLHNREDTYNLLKLCGLLSNKIFSKQQDVDNTEADFIAQ